MAPETWQELRAQLTTASRRLEARDYSGALESAKAAQSIDPENSAAAALIERITTQQQTETAVRNSASSNAFPVSAEAPRRVDGWAAFEDRARRRRIEHRIVAARTAVGNGRLDEARSAIAEIRELDPDCQEILFLEAMVHTAQSATGPGRARWWAAGGGVVAVLLAAVLMSRPGPQVDTVAEIRPLQVPDVQPDVLSRSEPAEVPSLNPTATSGAAESSPGDAVDALRQITVPESAAGATQVGNRKDDVRVEEARLDEARVADSTVAEARVAEARRETAVPKRDPASAAPPSAVSRPPIVWPPSAAVTVPRPAAAATAPPEPAAIAVTTAVQERIVLPRSEPPPVQVVAESRPEPPPSRPPAPLPAIAASIVSPPVSSVFESPRSNAALNPAPAAAVPAIANDEQLVRQTLQRYRAAYSGLDARSAQAVWPDVNEAALARAFGELQAQELTFADCAVEMRGAAATAVCRGSARYVPKIGSREPRLEARTWNFSLRKTGTDWQIASALAR